MGHYDDCYEEDAAEERKKRGEELTRYLHKAIDKLDLNELESLWYVASHLKDYRAFMRVMNHNANYEDPGIRKK